MKKTTLYPLLLCLVGFFSTHKALAQDLFECELAIQLSATGTCDSTTGTITVDILNGFGESYSIYWSNQHTRNFSGSVVTTEESFTITGLPAARHTIIVVDEYSQCEVNEQVDVVPNYVQGAISVQGTPATCNGFGSIEVAIEGNEPSYTVDVRGPVSANYLANSNNFSIHRLTSGEYEVAISQGECVQTFYTSVGFTAGIPSLELSAAADDCGINAGSVDFLINDGVAPYVVELAGPTTAAYTVDGSFSADGLVTGRYTATLTDSVGCRSIAVIDLNTTPLSAAISSLPVIPRGSGLLRVLASGGFPDYVINYEGPISGSRTATDKLKLIPVPGGTYEVTVTDAEGLGCSVTETVVVEERTSDARVANSTIGNPLSGDQELIHQNFPNPFAEQSIIRFELPQAMEVLVTIHDQFGRIISTNKQAYGKGLNEFVVNGSELTPGMYFYTISTDDFKATKRMIAN